MRWLTWFGRWSERDQAYQRLASLREQYSALGERVIRISNRTELARRSVGSTQRSFDFVDQAFASVTQEYARLGELLEQIDAGLAKGRIGDFAGAEAVAKGMEATFVDLDSGLAQWESLWQSVPRVLADADNTLAELGRQVDAVVTTVGSPLPLSEQFTSLKQHLDRTRSVLAQGNPIEANHLLDDFRIAAEKTAEEISLYGSGANAIRQVETEHGQVRAHIPSDVAPSGSAELAEIEGLISELRPSLANGRLEHFQHILYDVQRKLAAVRSAAAQNRS